MVALRQATSEDQPQYAIADALGRPGQRMLSGLIRSTPEVAQEIQDYLISRQAGQGNRVASFVADAFDAPNSANATKEAMEQARNRAANANYSVPETTLIRSMSVVRWLSLMTVLVACKAAVSAVMVSMQNYSHSEIV